MICEIACSVMPSNGARPSSASAGVAAAIAEAAEAARRKGVLLIEWSSGVMTEEHYAHSPDAGLTGTAGESSGSEGCVQRCSPGRSRERHTPAKVPGFPRHLHPVRRSERRRLLLLGAKRGVLNISSRTPDPAAAHARARSAEHTSELQS